MNWTAFFGVLSCASGFALFIVLMSLDYVRHPAWLLGGTFVIAALSLATFASLSS